MERNNCIDYAKALCIVFLDIPSQADTLCLQPDFMADLLCGNAKENGLQFFALF